MSHRLRLDPHELVQRAQEIRLLLLDVDGVLTDGHIILDDQGVESKHFSVRDGSGISFWRQSGRQVGILSGRSAPVVQKRAAELGISPVVQGAGNKHAAFQQILQQTGLAAHQVCYMGDDLPDLPVLSAGVGLAACPADAAAEVLRLAELVTEARGGRGAVRELIEILMNATGCWEPIVATLLASRPTAQPASLTQPDLPAQHNPDQLVTNSNQPK